MSSVGDGSGSGVRTAWGRRRARVLLVEDHPLVRHGLAELIGQEPDLEVCGQAESRRDALRAMAQGESPDVAVVDLSLADGSGLEVIKRLSTDYPSVRVLVLSMYEETLYAERVLKAGALGYINKERAVDEVIAAIREVLKGRHYLSQEMIHRVLCGLRQGLSLPDVERLTDRELEIFDLIGRGRNARQIADQLGLSTATVYSHQERIKHKLNVDTQAELVQRAVRWVVQTG